ncbi:MAG: manganese-dependent inorganic pyrophosphatase [Finegoldia sp.]|nr:manganese-dependent inorganic pyrophosphatase [Finegoldia sp.]
MKKVYISGHKNPDTDSICSALAYQYLKSQVGEDGVEYIAMRQGEPNLETQFVLNYFDVQAPILKTSMKEENSADGEKNGLILVDHNERSQAVDDIEEAEILEIIDHHRVANITTNNPVYFRAEPIGCTCTILTKEFNERKVEIPKKIAGLLVSAIISDTLLFRSPTTTDDDRKAVEKLAKIAEIDPESYSLEMFKAGTSIEGKTPVELLNEDVKSFEISGKKARVAQVFTMDFETVEKLKESLLEEMEKIRVENNEDTFVLILTDIYEEASHVLVNDEFADALANEFESQAKDNEFYAKGLLSRKKQMIPNLTEAINKSL